MWNMFYKCDFKANKWEQDSVDNSINNYLGKTAQKEEWDRIEKYCLEECKLCNFIFNLV